MKLSRLLAPLGLSCPKDTEITALTCDSRQVTPGALFVALDGSQTDGNFYIAEAIAKGAAAVLCRDGPAAAVPVVSVTEPRKLLGPLAAEFYGHPAKAMTLIAITGTKGKTTTAHMVRDILAAAGYKPGMIGTLGAFVGRERLADSVNTTPEPITLHRLLRQMADAGCSHVVMEASSQAMKLHRLEGITFDAALFLNLSPDHIRPGEHADFEEYRACKAALFRQCQLAVGNAADPNWPAVAARIPPGTPVRTFGPADCRPGGGLSTVLAPDYTISLPGKYNGENALAALTLCRALSVPEDAIRQGLAHVTVPGRTQLFPNHRGITVLIDYAHNGDSFRALLSTLKEYPHRRIIIVFGAGGDRPVLRRRDMANAAAEWADFVVITADNPRRERAEDICADISAALAGRIPSVVIPDRRQAIFFALNMAREGDIVALLGKGHEEYMEVNGVRHPFSEREVLEEYFSVVSKHATRSP